MRKLILSMVFVLATGTMVNANSTIDTSKLEVVKDCFGLADIGASTLGILYDLSYGAEHAVFTILYDACMEQN